MAFVWLFVWLVVILGMYLFWSVLPWWAIAGLTLFDFAFVPDLIMLSSTASKSDETGPTQKA